MFVLGYSSAAERVSGIYLVVGGRLRCERGVSISSVKLYIQRTTFSVPFYIIGRLDCQGVIKKTVNNLDEGFPL